MHRLRVLLAAGMNGGEVGEGFGRVGMGGEVFTESGFGRGQVTGLKRTLALGQGILDQGQREKKIQQRH